MSLPPTLEIRFPSYTSGSAPRCGPKSTLAGVVYLNITEPTRASCLSVNFVGSERISLAPESINTISHTTPKTRSIKKVYFNQTSVLWGDSKLRQLEELPAGIHMFHFSVEFPRVNYPQSLSTKEYTIKYVLQAKLLGPRTTNEAAIATASQPVMYVPETMVPAASASYAFCDSALDAEESQKPFHVQAISHQQGFRPGGQVDLQLRITGHRSLRRIQLALRHQTDCFYPQVPEPEDEQLDLGRRLWSTEQPLSEPIDLAFERDSCSPASSAENVCTEHQNTDTGRIRSNQCTYHAHMHADLPAGLLVLQQTGYLRFVYFAEITLYYSAAWGGHLRKARVRVPLPVFTNVPQDSLHQTPQTFKTLQQPAPVLRAPAEQHIVAEQPSKRVLGVVDLGLRLQQLIPRRTPASVLGISSGGATKLRRPGMRSASHGRALTEQQQSPWHDLDQAPPLPVFSSPQTRPNTLNPAAAAAAAAALDTPRYSVSGFSLTFLRRLRDFYYLEANSQALATLIYSFGSSGSSMADICPPPSATATDPAAGIIPSIFSLTTPRTVVTAAGCPSNVGGPGGGALMSAGRRNSRMSVHSALSSNTMMATPNECVLPRIEAIMTSFRDPVTSHVSTWSAFGPDPHRLSAASNGTTARYSRMSSISVSSNDTACAGGRMSSTKELLPTDVSPPPLAPSLLVPQQQQQRHYLGPKG
ncbi:hypothetical protein GGI07_002488 [Coemansia sp. Benny D115]|nr:hypothetical protein GGI07_002488 [Coemansia sp. Benny D115]